MAGDRVETAPGVKAIIKGDTPPEIKPDKRIGWKLPTFVVSMAGALALLGRQIIDPGSGAEPAPIPPVSAPATDNNHTENSNPGNAGSVIGTPEDPDEVPAPPALKIDGNQRGPDFDGDGQGDDILPLIPNMSGDALAKADIKNPAVGPAPSPVQNEPVLPMTQPGNENSVKA